MTYALLIFKCVNYYFMNHFLGNNKPNLEKLAEYQFQIIMINIPVYGQIYSSSANTTSLLINQIWPLLKRLILIEKAVYIWYPCMLSLLMSN